jgi:hypothetical protein
MATENDIVLIYLEENPMAFARIEGILPDSKPDWYHVKLLILQVPLQAVTWILRDIYINGETFQMNGKAMRLELVEAPSSDDVSPNEDPETETEKSPEQNGSVISLKDFKKN